MAPSFGLHGALQTMQACLGRTTVAAAGPHTGAKCAEPKGLQQFENQAHTNHLCNARASNPVTLGKEQAHPRLKLNEQAHPRS